MNLLSSQNTKLKKDGIATFAIPAFRSHEGFVTCPGAKDCVKGCYARQGFYGMSWVKDKKERNLRATLDLDFVAQMDAEIKKKKVRILRIHDAGDFYSLEYAYKWYAICQRNPKVQFYAYTKMIPMFKGVELPKNLTIIFSYGGKWDHLIEVSDRHSKVFANHEALERSGYADATKSDLVALNSMKVGLAYHGGKNLNWGAH